MEESLNYFIPQMFNFSGGDLMKKRILGLVLTCAMLAGLMSMIFAASPFRDVPSSHWAYSKN